MDLEDDGFQFHRKFIDYSYQRPYVTLDYSTPAEVYF